ncbi:tetratricopeptide repeat protein [Alkalinema sp. FACHB-956]|uniref:tetratricopeptide repeat protein n=1 Tax=Alkalinema sp. FACHB-956 TaxID=2692768 RepID=UPI0016892EFF|nr:tetratricopeptide repeat protein [Alkalinema sp. FACHB-956]MBD2329476.1 tetratricopeptide repeat protein [Alkalinema sp. FACHB-956]
MTVGQVAVGQVGRGRTVGLICLLGGCFSSIGVDAAIATSRRPQLPNASQAKAICAASPLLLEVNPLAADAWPKYDPSVQLFDLPKTPAAFYEIAQNSYDSDIRLAAISRAIELAPNYVDAYQQRGWLRQRDFRDFASAIADYRRVLELEPEHEEVQVRLVQSLEGLGNWKGAIAEYDRLVAKRPNGFEYRLHRAYAYQQLQNWQSAIQDYTQAIKLVGKKQSNDKNWAFLLGWVNTDLHKLYMDRGNLYALANQRSQALADYDRALNSTSSRFEKSDIYKQRCKLHVALGDVSQAKADARQAEWYLTQGKPLAQVSANFPLPKTGVQVEIPTMKLAETAPELIRVGLDLWVRNQESDFLEAAVTKDPNYAPAYYHRGSQRLKAGRVDGAIADFDKAIQLNPKFSLAYQARGSAYLKQQKFDSAIADFNQVLDVDPNFSLALIDRAQAYQQTKQMAAAMQDLNRAIAVDPFSELALSDRAELREATGDLAGSLTDNRRVKQLQRRWFNLANRWSLPARLPERRKR